MTTQFEPRWYQKFAMSFFDSGGKRGIYCWARRTGKDTTFLHQTVKMMHQRKGTYLHMLPNAVQGRKVIWDALDLTGTKILDQVFPEPLRRKTHDIDMQIELNCGSIWQLAGADYFDSWMGSNPIGIVFSEMALTNPLAWHYFRPILAQNGGWAAFISTPRGYNHFHDLLQIAQASDTWDYDIVDAIQAGIMTKADIDREIREGMPEELARQEYLCDFSAANVGSILGRYLEQAERESRVLPGEDDRFSLYDPDGPPLEVSCDLGFSDASAFWFWQAKADGFALVHHLMGSGGDAQNWCDALHDCGLPIGTLWLPHDARHRTSNSRHNVIEQFKAAGFKCKVVEREKTHIRINAARSILPRCWFDATRCKEGLMCLRAWQYDYDAERRVFGREPRHDYASDSADAFTYGALVMREHTREQEALEPKVRSMGEYTLDHLWQEREDSRRQFRY